MKRFFFLLAVTLSMATASHAQGVVSCASESGVSFQATPCAEGETTGSAMSPSAKAKFQVRNVEEDAVPTAAPTPGPVAGPAPPKTAPPDRTAIHSRSDALQPGTSDLLVLNNRRWGKPQRITRNRDARAWHEYWDYQTGANGGRQLHFVNGMLASVGDLGPPAPAASMTPVAMAEGQ